jgi:hypothetical protein
MKGRDERVWSSLHSGWLDGIKAVALIEGVAEIVGDLDEVFAIRRSCSSPTASGLRTLFEKLIRRYTN